MKRLLGDVSRGLRLVAVNGGGIPRFILIRSGHSIRAVDCVFYVLGVLSGGEIGYYFNMWLQSPMVRGSPFVGSRFRIVGRGTTFRFMFQN